LKACRFHGYRNPSIRQPAASTVLTPLQTNSPELRCSGDWLPSLTPGCVPDYRVLRPFPWAAREGTSSGLCRAGLSIPAHASLSVSAGLLSSVFAFSGYRTIDYPRNPRVVKGSGSRTIRRGCPNVPILLIPRAKSTVGKKMRQVDLRAAARKEWRMSVWVRGGFVGGAGIIKRACETLCIFSNRAIFGSWSSFFWPPVA
jgi:hypothetical protein